MTKRNVDPGLSDPYADPVEFWRETGRNSPRGPNDHVAGARPAHFRQEAALAELLLTPSILGSTVAQALMGFKPESIFEVGCGRGRLAHFFARIWPETSYTAIDVGQTQLRDAKRLRPDGIYKQADILTYVPDPVSELAAYDLVVSSEVLMHIRPNDLQKAYSAMKMLTNRAKGRILVIEWVPLLHDLEKMQIAYWNFPHDYPALFRSAGSSILAEIRTDKQVIYWLKP